MDHGPQTTDHRPLDPAAAQQEEVRAYFQSAALYWRRIYEDGRLIPRIYRERREAILQWGRGIGLPAGARALEVGCGAGLTAVALAQHGFFVEAIDSTAEMIELTREETARAGVSARLRVSLGDAHKLEFPDACFDLVMAVGVIPWLHSEARGVREMGRVLKPGGYLIVTADNRARLNRLLDPLSSPLTAPARLAAKTAIRLVRGPRPPEFDVKKHYPRQVDALVAAAGLRKIASRTVGFGPFSFFDRPVLSDGAGNKVHAVLQRLADRNIPLLRLTGSHYLLLARKG